MYGSSKKRLCKISKKIGNYTVLEITLLKAIQSGVFDKIVVNTDDPDLENLSKNIGVDFYKRDDELASSNATSDQVVLDFFEKNEGDRIFWVNTVSPLQTLTDIKNFVDLSQENSQSSIDYSFKLFEEISSKF